MNGTSRERISRTGEEGYFLVGLVVICFLLLLALGVAAPRVAKQLEREREVESEHRAEEYVRAIQLYYRKNGRYPASVDQLTGSGNGSGGSGLSSTLNVKYLRQKYNDPLTNGEYRLIHFGEAKTEVKGFFGEPLQGVAMSNLGSPAGPVSGSQPSSVFGLNGSASAIGGAGSVGTLNSAPAGASQGFSLGNTLSGGVGGLNAAGGSGAGLQTPALGGNLAGTAPGVSGTGADSTGTPASGATGTLGTGATPANGAGAPTSGYGSFSSGSTSATSFQGNKGAIVGVASTGKGHGLVEWNGSENIEDWEFLYDPRVEQLKARVSIFGGSGGASGSLGGGFKAADGTTALGFGQTGTTGAASGTNGFGSSSGFGTQGTFGTPGNTGTSGGQTKAPPSPPAGSTTLNPQQ